MGGFVVMLGLLLTTLTGVSSALVATPEMQTPRPPLPQEEAPNRP